MKKILELLNDAQQEAVKTIDGPLLILAGAGSGKTKTITSRLAYLLAQGIPASSILTLTFTNKAATQMRDRALSLIDESIYPPLLCTFHKFGLLFLKFNMEKLGRKNSFVVIDNDDKKRIIKSFGIDMPVGLVVNEISKYKNSLISPSFAWEKAELPNYKKIAQIYENYEKYIEENNLVDFDDLLALPYRILDENEQLCKETSQRYRYVMVDEYQDTNDLQYKLIRKICSTHNNICVVGDDDQSIYGWRGANIKNILNFKNEFRDTKIIKLENNYRSTTNILKAANELIEHNRSRLGKVLKSTKADGAKISVLESNNEKIESTVVSNSIRGLIADGVNPKEIAILYRINALSRSLEEGLNRMGISYNMVGGVKFYERMEIKDLISYLRIVANPDDDFSLKRIINRPKRGLGKVTISKLVKGAYENHISVYEYITIKTDELKSMVSKKSYSALMEFSENLERLIGASNEAIYSTIDELENLFGIKKYYEQLPDSLERVSNIDEFYALFKDQVKQNPEITIDEFLDDIALQSAQDSIDSENISIMSIHASKGLEFEHLFVIGMEEGFLPLVGDGSDIEEERRLGYVAITRAKEELTLSFSQSRFYKGRRTELKKSRFLKESGVCKGSLVLEKTTSYRKGDLVKHKIFGIGRILEISRVKREFKLKINFSDTKREIVASFVEKL